MHTRAKSVQKRLIQWTKARESERGTFINIYTKNLDFCKQSRRAACTAQTLHALGRDHLGIVPTYGAWFDLHEFVPVVLDNVAAARPVLLQVVEDRLARVIPASGVVVLVWLILLVAPTVAALVPTRLGHHGLHRSVGSARGIGRRGLFLLVRLLSVVLVDVLDRLGRGGSCNRRPCCWLGRLGALRLLGRVEASRATWDLHEIVPVV
mmetsp:Transcript_18514/g.44586  ORF Transcript_18514/g.44586 Transcript_18514/m.44586 type:complete len:208 (-) Transcript_18514:263-886(-)